MCQYRMLDSSLHTGQQSLRLLDDTPGLLHVIVLVVVVVVGVGIFQALKTSFGYEFPQTLLWASGRQSLETPACVK